MSYLFVALGGKLGAMLRMFVSQLLPFAFGRMSANIIGSFAMGIALVTIRAKVGSKDFTFTERYSGWLYYIYHIFVGRIQALGGG